MMVQETFLPCLFIKVQHVNHYARSNRLKKEAEPSIRPRDIVSTICPGTCERAAFEAE